MLTVNSPNAYNVSKVVFVLIWTIACNGICAKGVEIRTVVLSGDPIPGNDNLSYQQLDRQFALNNNGTVVFDARLSNAQSALTFATTDGGMSVIARSTDPPSGTPAGISFLEFGDILLSDSEDVVFGALLRGAESGAGIWSFHPEDGMSLVARTGLLDSPNESVLQADGMGRPKLSRGGDVSFETWRTSPLVVFTRQIWQASVGDLTQIVGQDNSDEFVLPGLLGRNDSGETLFFSTHPGEAPGGGGVDDPNEGIWKFHDGQLRRVADSRPIENAPGANDVFREFHESQLNNKGDVVFAAVFPDRVTTGIYRYSDEVGLSSVARTGQQLDETTFRVAQVYSPLVDSNGDITFNADSEDGRRSIWTVNQVGEYRPILIGNDELPGVPNSRFFSGSFSANRHGQFGCRKRVFQRWR